MKYFVFIVPLSLFLLIYLAGNLSIWENFSMCFFVYFFLNFLMNLGNKIVILDLTVLMACLTCLIMPIVFYHVYTKDNPLARLWIKYMPISSDEYFSFAMPGILAMVLGIKLRFGKLEVNANPGVYLENVKRYLAIHPKLGFILIGIGLGSGFLDFLAPASLREIFFLLAHLTFVGAFYVIYSPSKKKRLIVPGMILLMIGQSIITGMFGEFIFILACSLVLLLLGRKISFQKKLGFALIGIFLIILIQSIKKDYRQRSWQVSGADPVYFAELTTDRIVTPS